MEYLDDHGPCFRNKSDHFSQIVSKIALVEQKNKATAAFLIISEIWK